MSTIQLPVVVPDGPPLFPGVIAPVTLSGMGVHNLINHLAEQGGEKRVAAAMRRPDGSLSSIGVEAVILRVLRKTKDGVVVLLRGDRRVRLGEETQRQPFIVHEARAVEDLRATGVEADALAQSVRELVKQLITVSPQIPDEAQAAIDALTGAAALADGVSAHIDMPPIDRLTLLESTDVTERLRLLVPLLTRQIEVVKVKTDIDQQVQRDIGKTQRDYVLRQKMKAIQEELGEADDDGASDLDRLAERLEEAQLPEEAAKAARRELTRLRGMQPGGAEAQVARTYLEWLLDVPWAKRTEDRIDLAEARAVLEADHHGLAKVKKRVLEFLAVRKLAPDKRGPILCLVGPPGVGKTSLGRSIASTLGRKLVRISLGGVRDEAEIRGHRRTYVGALPGRIVSALKKAGTMNPVFVLDEVDKLGADHRGDPSAALLEVLDPEQNFSFTDHYLEVPVDLSQVMFIATANQLDTIPGPLRDRLEIIEVPGYTRAEKREIARRHLVPRQLAEHGLPADAVGFTDEALTTVVDGYTREAGVRDLERQLAAVCRAVAVDLADGSASEETVTSTKVEVVLGPPRFVPILAEADNEPGVATGLAWTPSGGEVLFIEATRMPGKGKLVLTGQLGDVMKESAQAALSYTRAHAAELGVDPAVFEQSDLHVHVPAGAVPKDGPSAGVTMLTTIVSLLTGRKVHTDVAMTGEVTLRGRVLPVGGIKEKVLAAHRAGIKTVVLPERNRKDVLDVPDEVRAELDIRFASTIDDVLGPALAAAGPSVPVLPLPVVPPPVVPPPSFRAA